MRTKDEYKVEKIYNAAITVVNNDGLQGASIAKIAKHADVSPATIYLYFENKEDMIRKLFLYLKEKMGHSYYSNTSTLTTSKSTFRTLWFNYFKYITEYPEEFQFLQNFSNCPLILTVNKKNIADYCPVFEKLFEDSKDSGLIRKLSNDVLYSMLFAPISHLVKQHKALDTSIESTELIEIFETSWRAIEENKF